MNFKKLKIYSVLEMFQLLINSVANRLLTSIPKGLTNTHKLVDTLYSKGIHVRKEKNAICFDYIINDKTFLIQLEKNSSDSYVFQQIVLNNEYKIIVDFFKNNNIQLRNVIDAGANIGLTSIFLKAYYPDSNIIALEPSQNTFDRLNNNMVRNHLDVICLKKGLWSHKAFLSSDSSFRDGLDWSFRLIENPDNNPGMFEAISIPDLIKEFNLDLIDLVKIDIEGGEVSLFSDLADLGWLKHVRVLAIEIHDEFNCRAEIEHNLIEHNFVLRYSGELTIGVNSNLVENAKWK